MASPTDKLNALDSAEVAELRRLFSYFAEQNPITITAANTGNTGSTNTDSIGTNNPNPTDSTLINSKSTKPQQYITWRGLKQLLTSLGLDYSAAEVKLMLQPHSSYNTNNSSNNSNSNNSNNSNNRRSNNNTSTTTNSSSNSSLMFSLSFDDFLCLYASSTKSLSPLQELKSIFSLLDNTNSGLITIQLLQQILIGLSSNSNHSIHNDPNSTDIDLTTGEELIDTMLKEYFGGEYSDKLQETINFQTFVKFLYY